MHSAVRLHYGAQASHQMFSSGSRVDCGDHDAVAACIVAFKLALHPTAVFTDRVSNHVPYSDDHRIVISMVK